MDKKTEAFEGGSKLGSSGSYRPKSKRNFYDQHNQMASVIRRTDFDGRNVFGGQKNRPYSWHPPNKRERNLVKQYIVEQSRQSDQVHLPTTSNLIQQEETTGHRSNKNYVINESASSVALTDEASISPAVSKPDAVCESMKLNDVHRSAINFSTTKDGEYNIEELHSQRPCVAENVESIHSISVDHLKTSLPESENPQNSLGTRKTNYSNFFFKKANTPWHLSSQNKFSVSTSNLTDSANKTALRGGVFNSFEAMRRTSLMSSFKKSRKDGEDKANKEYKGGEKTSVQRQPSALKDGINSVRNFFLGKSNKSADSEQGDQEKIRKQKVFVVSNTEGFESLIPNSIPEECFLKNDSVVNAIPDKEKIGNTENQDLVDSECDLSNNSNHFSPNAISNSSEDIKESTESHKRKLKELKEKFFSEPSNDLSFSETDTLQPNPNRLSDASSRSSIDSLNSKLIIPAQMVPPEVTSTVTKSSQSFGNKSNNMLITTGTQSENVSAFTYTSSQPMPLFEKNDKPNSTASQIQKKINKPMNQFKRMSLPSPIIENQELSFDSSDEPETNGLLPNESSIFKLPYPVDNRKSDFHKTVSSLLQADQTGRQKDFTPKSHVSEIEMLKCSESPNNHPNGNHLKMCESNDYVDGNYWSTSVEFCHSRHHTKHQRDLDNQIIQMINALDDELFDYSAVPAQRSVFNHIAEVVGVTIKSHGDKIDQSIKKRIESSNKNSEREKLIDLLAIKIELLSEEKSEIKCFYQTSQDEMKEVREDLERHCNASCSIKFDRLLSNINTILKLTCHLSRRMSNLEVLSHRNRENINENEIQKKKLKEQLNDAKKIFSKVKATQSQFLKSLSENMSAGYCQRITEKIQTASKFAMHLEILKSDLKDYKLLKERLITLNEI